MQHFAETAAREKRQREEPQLSCAEPCLADVQLGCPLHVQLGSPEHVLLLRAALAEVKVCRGGRNKTSLRFKGKPPSWCQQQAHLLESASAKVDQAFAKAAALSVGIPLELLIPRVYDRQWQPASAQERQRVITNKRLATTAITRASAPASGHSTPARRQQSVPDALQHELKRLDSSTPKWRPHFKTPAQIEHNLALQAQAVKQRRYDADDHAWHPGHGFRPETELPLSPLQLAQRKRLSEIPQHVSDGTSSWNGTAEFWGLVTLKQLVELDVTSPHMREHFEITTGGVGGECAVWNIGGNPGYDPGHAFLECGLLPRLVKAIAVMVIHSFFASDCTVFCFAVWL